VKIYNYSHPVTPEQLDELATMFSVEAKDIEITSISVQIDHSKQLAPQIKALLPTDDRGSATERLWIIPPGYSPAAAVLVTEMLHEYGGFVHMIRLRPVAGSTPTKYEVAEVIVL
jgi:hypothetical protein